MTLKGTLSELPLSDLIEVVSLGGKTGRLDVDSTAEAPAGFLCFREGRLVGASFGALEGEKAFYALLGLREGSFKFDPKAELGEDSIDMPTSSLLMEGMRRLDEIARLRDTVPAPARLAYVGGDPDDRVEAGVLGYLGPGVREVGDVVAGALVDGLADEYDTLRAVGRLVDRGVVRLTM